MSQRYDNVSTSVLRPLQVTPSPSPTPSLSSLSLSNNHSEMKSTAIKSTQFQATETPHHPSKMPIPPPRRKKKSLEVSIKSIDKIEIILSQFSIRIQIVYLNLVKHDLCNFTLDPIVNQLII